MASIDFEFTQNFGDARVEELKLLSWIAQNSKQSGTLLSKIPYGGAWRDLVIYLVSNQLLTTFNYERTGIERKYLTDPCKGHGFFLDYEMDRARVKALRDLYENQPLTVQLSHQGRVRLSELKQALRSGREREPFGILWDTRHWEQDLQIAILEAGTQSPLGLMYLDMNGLKQVNDKHGHDAGDLALKAYFQAIASALSDQGQAYRLGGDEVLAILPNHDTEKSVQFFQLACKKLMGERLDNIEELLSISGGVTICTDPPKPPTDLRSIADEVQYIAKQKSRETNPRPSVLAVDGQTDLIVIPHD